MNHSYKFISDSEPTEEQLEMLMQAVLEDVKKRAMDANLKFKALQLQQIEEAIEQTKHLKKKYD